MENNTLLTYLVTCIIAAATPGPGTISVIVYGATIGWKRTIPVILGVQLGMFSMAVLALTGVTAAITASETLFVILQYIGALYIAWLGIGSLLASRKTGEFNTALRDQGNLKNFYHGAIVTFASPKTLLFFTSFFPLFIDAKQPIFQQNLFLLVILLACTLAVHIVYSFFMQNLTAVFQKYQAQFNFGVGVIFLALAGYMITQI